MKQVRILRIAGILLLAALLLLGTLACSTTSGSLLERASEMDRSDSGINDDTDLDPEPYEPEGEETGLEIRSTPRGASVFLNNRFMGLTPVVLEDVETGRHKLTLKKDGYYSESQWISYSGGYQTYYLDLEEITGFLRVQAHPQEAEINVGSTWLPASKLHELPIGTYTLRIRAFGYEEQSLPIRIVMRQVTELQVSLREATFALSELRSNRRVFNPRNSGFLGVSRIRFRVSTYGTGRALVMDEQNRVVWTRELGGFTTWEQELDWDGRDPLGAPLPDGRYTVRVEAKAGQSEETAAEELSIRIDSSVVLHFRSLWSGSAGLLYAPSTDILPGGSIQVSSMILAHISSGSGGSFVRVPVNLALRSGLGRGNRFELDTSIGGIIGYSQETFHMPWLASAAFKASLLRPYGTIGLGSAAQIKLTFQYAFTDILANFSGISIGLPTSLHWGPLSLQVAPEIILAPWYVSYDVDDKQTLGVYSWFYGRLGLLVDLSPFTLGASVSLRSQPFDQGFYLDLPFQTALEAHWLIPNTQLFLSLSVAGEFESVDSYYLMGGAGLGILN
jgi:hypothetical protein